MITDSPKEGWVCHVIYINHSVLQLRSVRDNYHNNLKVNGRIFDAYYSILFAIISIYYCQLNIIWNFTHWQGGEFGFSREDCDNRFHNNLKYHCDMIKDDPGKKQFCNVSFAAGAYWMIM